MALPDKHRYPSVHRGIVHAALLLLRLEQHSASKRYTAGDAYTLIEEAAAPDRIGDRQQGRGMHYYCASKPDGTLHRRHPIIGGYANGKGEPSPSLLTMLDAEYRSAIALYRSGRPTPAMESLTRAMHMLADLCCPPHSSGLTYFSRYAVMHKRYEARAAVLFWKQGGNTLDERRAAQYWAKAAVGSVPYDTFRNLLHGSAPAKKHLHDNIWQSTWRSGTLAVICNRIAESGAAELPAVLGSDTAALDASIRRRVLLAIANCAALLAAFDRDVDDTALRVPEEQHPYWLCAFGASAVVSESPLYLRFEDDGAFTLSTQDGKYLAATRLGRVVLTDQTAGMITRYRFGREPLLTLYPNGDQSRTVAMIRGQLHCIRRIGHLQSALFLPQISFVLADRPPLHARFLYR